ncbi:MAG: hypothetical protein HY694_13370 [Deltaproteobacteria bacterium]|nr:hypothetical protein [Deltaproteobacteria bacterium]
MTFKKGKIIDFGKLVKAVDGAGFKASEIKIWARGLVEQTNGKFSLKVSGSNQSFTLRENEQTTKLKANLGKEVKVAGKLELDKGPPSLILESFEM